MKKLPLLFLFFAGFLTLCYLHFHGFTAYDDGWFLQDGLRLLNGDVPYKDFHYLYNPGSLYLNALGFALFGKSILASRIISLINSCIAVLITFWICKKLKINKVISFLICASYIAWGPGHVNFLWPVMFCLTTAIATGGLFLKVADDKKKNLSFYLIGILAAVTFILKQNFGLAILVVDFIFFVIVKKNRNLKSFGWFLIGYLTVATVQVIYFISTNSLGSYINDFYNYTIVKIYEQGILNSSLPWQYPGNPIYQIIKAVLYFSPFILSAFTIYILRNTKNKSLIYFPLVSVTYFALSIRPTTDFIHLTPLIAISLIPIGIIYKHVEQFKHKILLVTFLVVICYAGFYSALFRNYYRWSTPLIQQNKFLNVNGTQIWVDNINYNLVNGIKEYYDQNAKSEKYTFVYFFSPMYYIILDKKNPTKYDDLQLGGAPNNDQKEIINALINKKVRHILVDSNIDQDKSMIGKFILQNYTPAKHIYDFTVWEKRGKN